MMKFWSTPFFLLISLLVFQSVHSQQVELLQSHGNVSLRGLSVSSEQVIWVSGSGGTVGRSVDAGSHWQWTTVPGFEKRDFRDIQAFDSSIAVIMAIEEPAQILKTIDGGAHWTIVFTDSTKGMFLDAMHFIDPQHGIVVGDPINDRFYLARTSDGGNSWQPIPFAERPVTDSGEACFASSGTNIQLLNKHDYAIVSGGMKSRLFINQQPSPLMLMQGTSSTGANSIATQGNKWMIVGGDFTRDTIATGNFLFSPDKGNQWRKAEESPHGYKSGVSFVKDQTWICCGTSGVDITIDDGMHWRHISKEPFHACAVASNKQSIFLAGSKGRIARIMLP